MFVILEGTVIVEARGDVEIELGPGEFVGELALLVPDAIRSARVRAVRPTSAASQSAPATSCSCSTTSPGSRSRCSPSLAERLWRARQP